MEERRTDEECPLKWRREGLKSIWGSHTSAGGVGEWEAGGSREEAGEEAGAVSIGFPFKKLGSRKEKQMGVITRADV